MRNRLPLIVALAGLLTGCTGKKVTEIVVSIATDLKIPQEMAVIDFEVTKAVSSDTGPSDIMVQQRFDVDPSKKDAIKLPATVALFPDRETSVPIHIEITGRSATNAEIIWREAQLPFAKDRILLLRMNLLRSCLYKRCGPGKTCGEKGCESIHVDPNDLPTATTINAFRGIDGSSLAPDGLFDAGVKKDRPSDVAGPKDLKPGKEGPPPDTKPGKEGPPPDTKPGKEGLPPDLKPEMDIGLPDIKPAVDLWPIDLAPLDKAPGMDLPLLPDSIQTGCQPTGWCVIAPGTFTMGSPGSETCRESDEDEHQVTLTRYFEIGRTEVTESDFYALMGYDPSQDSTCGTTCPVEYVSWHMAAAYCNALSGTTYTKCFTCTGSGSGVVCDVAAKYSSTYYDCPGYRLPTEAEWEYAARAGIQAPLHNNMSLTIPAAKCLDPATQDSAADLIAWYMANSGGAKKAVGLLQANTWGLVDMAGNVAEWTGDKYTSNLGTGPATDPWTSVTTEPTMELITVRGSRIGYYVGATRSANRGAKYKYVQMDDHGLRCVRSLTKVNP